MSTGWIIGIVIFVAIWIWVTYEIFNAPLMPDDFELKEEDIWPLDERPNTKEDANEKN
tara:strand:+ start:569 stop:742 length:174 start_codon:yes stop_codon:yes gene_type:complete